MSNDDILCEAPGPGGRTCTLPYGHEPQNIHAFDVELPHDLSDIIEGIMRSTEEAKARYEKQYRKQRLMFWLWGCMAALYLGLTIWKVTTP